MDVYKPRTIEELRKHLSGNLTPDFAKKLVQSIPDIIALTINDQI